MQIPTYLKVEETASILVCRICASEVKKKHALAAESPTSWNRLKNDDVYSNLYCTNQY